MGNLNSVTMSGNLTRDPEWRDVGDSGVCGLSIAVNERYRDGDEWKDRGHFFDWAVWRGLGAWCRDNLSKGDPIVITGRAQYQTWEKDGQKRSAVRFIANDIEMRASGRKSDRATRQQTGETEPIDFSNPSPRNDPGDVPF